MEKLTDKPNTTGTSLKGYLVGVTYNDLVQTFGQPTYPNRSEDDKVQKEWVFSWKDNTYTIYDWKTYDEKYTIYQLTKWNVGAKSGASIYEFGEAIETLLKAKSGIEPSFIGS